jgi:hypothetical protein
MLDSTLIPDRATPMLLLKHQNLYKWRTYCRVCVFQSGALGSIYSVPREVPRLGRDVSMMIYDRAGTTWPTTHEFWPNRLSEVGSLSAAF